MRKFKVGDKVKYGNEITVIAALYGNGNPIIEYSNGWIGEGNEHIAKEGEILQYKKYYHVNENNLQLIKELEVNNYDLY